MSSKESESSAARRKMGVHQRRYILRAVLIASIFAAVGIFHAKSHVDAVLRGKQLSEENRKNRELLRANDELNVRRAALNAANRLESIAKEQLDLGQPTARQVISIKDVAPETILEGSRGTAPRHQPPTIGPSSEASQAP